MRICDEAVWFPHQLKVASTRGAIEQHCDSVQWKPHLATEQDLIVTTGWDQCQYVTCNLVALVSPLLQCK